MFKLIVITREDEEKELDGKGRLSMMELIRGGGLDELLALCRGGCSCATCHGYVDEAFLDRLPRMSEDENDLLDSSSHRTPASRLSCQLPMSPGLDGLRVKVAPES